MPQATTGNKNIITQEVLTYVNHKLECVPVLLSGKSQCVFYYVLFEFTGDLSAV